MSHYNLGEHAKNEVPFNKMVSDQPIVLNNMNRLKKIHLIENSW